MNETPALLPVRMLNEHVYCPRLAYLEWTEHRFADNADTVNGRDVHRRVDRPRGRPPDPQTDGEDAPPISTAITVGSERLGLIARVDLLDVSTGETVPVEYKRGRPRSRERPLWDPELIQLCAQVMLLREEGYRVDHAEVYFAETRSRHRIDIDGELVARTLAAAEEARQTAALSAPPPPLVDSPKCPRCSLVGLCLPDETHIMRGRSDPPARRLVAGDPPSSPLYVSTPGARVTRRGGRVVLKVKGEEQEASLRLLDVSHICLFGNADIGSALMRDCFDEGIPVLWFSAGGWFRGIATGIPPGNIAVRMRQHRLAQIGAPDLAGAFVGGKIRNARTLLRRHGGDRAAKVVKQLAALGRAAEAATEVASLLGIEGTAARLYFGSFGDLLRGSGGAGPLDFAFSERNRRPPRDPVNALLSFAYSLLVKDCTVACLAAGLDPHVGFLHRPRFGRPAMALDLAEELRPLIADSVVLTAINNGEVQGEDFVSRAGGCALTHSGRRKFMATYERRMRTELRHPSFGYRLSYRRALELQARILGAVLIRDLPAYRPLTTR